MSLFTVGSDKAAPFKSSFRTDNLFDLFIGSIKMHREQMGPLRTFLNRREVRPATLTLSDPSGRTAQQLLHRRVP